MTIEILVKRVEQTDGVLLSQVLDWVRLNWATKCSQQNKSHKFASTF